MKTRVSGKKEWEDFREHATRFVCLRYVMDAKRKLFFTKHHDFFKKIYTSISDPLPTQKKVCIVDSLSAIRMMIRLPCATHLHKVFFGNDSLFSNSKSVSVFSRSVIIVLGEKKFSMFLRREKILFFHITEG